MIPRLWPDATVVCLGGGPSLTREDVETVRASGAKVIAVNDAYRRAPWADVLYGCDAQWWRWHHGVPTFGGLKFALEPPAAAWPGVQIVRHTGTEGLEVADCGGVRDGRNSGYQAINLAVHLGARRIVLLGYDMTAPADGPAHWFGEHPNGQRPVGGYETFVPYFDTLVAPLAAVGVDVINCSRVTALRCFPRMPLEQALAAAFDRGGPGRLTAGEQARVNAQVTTALGKYKALGLEAPAPLTAIANATVNA